MNLININTNQIRNRGSPPTTSIQKNLQSMKEYKNKRLREIQHNLINSLYLKLLGK
jgi:hypothetical protein